MPERLDSKYNVTREISRDEWMRSVEATDATGKAVRVDWFFVVDPKSRANFHRYRTAIKNVASPLLLDAVSRPGAYYTVWEILEGTDGATWLAQHPKDTGFRSALAEAAQVLGSYGFALTDANFIALQGAKGDVKPALTSLRSADRSTEEIAQLNQPLLETTKTSRSKIPVIKTPASKTTLPVLEPVPEAVAVTQPKAAAKTGQSKSQVTPLKAATPKPSLGLRFLALLVRVIPGAVALAGVIYFGAQATRQFLEPPAVIVPNVVGKTLAEAAQLLSEARLTPRPVEGSDQAKLRGVILTQNPAAGASITEQRVVEITVNQPRALLMPSLAGKTLTEAQIALKEAKLNVGRIARVPAPEGTARDYILGQNPAPQTEVVRGQSVTLLASGPRAPEGKTFIPALNGLNTEDAKTVIKLAGLRLVEIKTQISDLPYGTVLNQSPSADTIIELESDATLTVAVAANAAKPIIPQPVRPKPIPTTPNPTNPNTQGDGTTNPTTQPSTQPSTQPATQPSTQPSTQPATQPSTQPNNTNPNNLPPVQPTTSDTPVVTPDTPTPDTPVITPDTPTPDTPTLIEPRNETYRYEVPADIASGTLELRVTDIDGVRVVDSIAVVAGQIVNIPYTVRAEIGQGQVTILINGELKETKNI
jgi:beta-lactam-binding protein with PASTA domain